MEVLPLRALEVDVRLVEVRPEDLERQGVGGAELVEQLVEALAELLKRARAERDPEL